MIAISVDPSELAAIQAALDETPKQAERALVRSINKVLARVQSQGLKAIAARNDIPLKVLRARRRGKTIKAVRSRLAGLAWFGTAPVKASYLGLPRQTRRGARAGKHTFEGAFVATLPGGHTGIFRRRGTSRLPIVEEVVRLDAAEQALEAVGARIPAELEKVFFQELNYEQNVRGT